jgi:hypothetical protein
LNGCIALVDSEDFSFGPRTDPARCCTPGYPDYSRVRSNQTACPALMRPEGKELGAPMRRRAFTIAILLRADEVLE